MSALKTKKGITSEIEGMKLLVSGANPETDPLANMRIFVIGQTTVHWGRKEFGNIGNYYVTESFFKELNRVFPKAEIITTLQLSKEFCKRENVFCTDMSLYYSWSKDDLSNTLREYSIAYIYSQTNVLVDTTPFIEEVLKCDLVIDHSGDLWGENSNLVGENRFIIGLLKDKIVQLLGKKIVLFGSSPGPFDKKWLPLVHDVLGGFEIITTRELASKNLLCSYGINTSNVSEFPCPSFLFDGRKQINVKKVIGNTPLQTSKKPTVGFILCGWNMIKGPFNKWPRDDSEYNMFAELIEFIVKNFDCNVGLLSHSNGFSLKPEFKLIHGRDYFIQKQLYEIVLKRNNVSDVYLLDGIYSPHETRAIIGEYDLLVSGRVHGAVAGVTQGVPTIFIDYGHEPKAHKVRGFAKLVGLDDYIIDPSDINQMKGVFSKCWEKKTIIKQHLERIIPDIQEKSKENFNLLKRLADGN